MHFSLSAAFASLALLTVGGAISAGVAAEPTQYIRIDGATGAPNASESGGIAGASVAGAGDVNGDGRPDVVIGAPQEDNNARADSGSAYVVFGQPSPTTIDLANLGAQGFRIDGADAGEFAGRSVSGVGDVNGDRRPDLLVGAPGTISVSDSQRARPRGRAYVVFGKSSTTAVDLAQLGNGGFRITGKSFQYPDAFGFDVSGAGDLDRDRHADLIVVAAGNPGFEERFTNPSAYVVYGKRSTTEVRIDRLDRRGFRIAGLGGPTQAVAAAGDVNGDRRSDVIVGNESARVRRRFRAAAYVIFGARRKKTVNLARLGRRGFRIESANRGDLAGMSVAGAGDINRDKRADVIIGAPGFLDSGAAYVVFGKRSATPISLVTKKRPGVRVLGRQGFRITGVPRSFAGHQVAGVRDVNLDGRPDVALVAGGSVYVVFGKSSSSEVRLATLAGGGFKVDGAVYEPGVGGPVPGPHGLGAVAGAGDMNADGRGDVLVGAPGASHGGRPSSGSAYVFFSR